MTSNGLSTDSSTSRRDSSNNIQGREETMSSNFAATSEEYKKAKACVAKVRDADAA